MNGLVYTFRKTHFWKHFHRRKQILHNVNNKLFSSDSKIPEIEINFSSGYVHILKMSF